MAVHHDRGVRLVMVEQLLERRADLGHRRVVETGLAVLRRVAGGEQHLVALAQRDVERARELEDHVAAGFARPLSTNDTWRGVTPASVASASWLIRRCARQCCSSRPTGLGSTPLTLSRGVTSLGGN